MRDRNTVENDPPGGMSGTFSVNDRNNRNAIFVAQLGQSVENHT